MIEVKSKHELDLMRAAGKVTAAVLKQMTELVRPGISTPPRKKQFAPSGRPRYSWGIMGFRVQFALL